MANLFNIPQNYTGEDLFESLDDLRQFANDHEEELEGLRKFDILFDTDVWCERIGGKGHSLESMIDDMELEQDAYFEDVKAHHGTATIIFEDNGESFNLYTISY